MDDKFSYTFQDVAINDLIMPEIEMRTKVNIEGLDELARSIRQLGLIQPITVRKNGDKFELIAGFRRTKACEICGFHTITAKVIESDESTAELQKIHENMFREEVCSYDEGKYFKDLLAKQKINLNDLAIMIHKSPSFISRRMSLVDGDPLIGEAIRDGKINLSVAEELNKVIDDKSRLFLLGHVINNGATVDVVRSWRVQSNIEYSNLKHQQELAGSSGAPVPGASDEDLTKLVNDKGPEYEITENVHQYRTCNICSLKVELDDVHIFHLCPGCFKIVSDTLKK